jgi:hypothetical protein
VPPSFVNARFEWEEGDARVRAARPGDRRDLERVVDDVVSELRRRLGGTFSVQELVELYAEGTDWVLERAVAVAPENPGAWEGEAIAGAAFWRYAREAGDFAGGRRTTQE